MKVAILEVKQGERDPSKSITVAYRNLLVLKKYFKADMYVSASQLTKSRDDYDIIICGFSSTSTERHEATKFLLKNKKAKIFRLVGEYEQKSVYAPLFYSKREYHIIKNYEHDAPFKALSQTFLNINLLLAKAAPKDPQVKKYSNVYYGRWREDRADYAVRYLQGGAYLSTHPKNMKKYIAKDCHPTFIRPFIWTNNKETLRLFATSLYIEDAFTHTHYNCPANRFYEALFCGVVVLSQPEADYTWQRAGIDVGRDRIVQDSGAYLDLAGRILSDPKLMGRYLEEQRVWAENALKERDEVLQKIKELFISLV